VHHDVSASVDAVLRGLGEVVECEMRELFPETGTLRIQREPFPDLDELAQFTIGTGEALDD
jgi:hypothetical protein